MEETRSMSLWVELQVLLENPTNFYQTVGRRSM